MSLMAVEENIMNTIERLNFLRTIKPDGPGFCRIFDYAGAEVFEMCDPNDGLAPGDIPRLQYVVAGKGIWMRRLPPKAVSSQAQDMCVYKWKPVVASSGVVAEWAVKATPCKVAYFSRERFSVNGEIQFRIRGEWRVATDENDIKIPAGPIFSAWWITPFPPCPDCGGNLVWTEQKYGPGARRCVGNRTDTAAYDLDGGCGSYFSVFSKF